MNYSMLEIAQKLGVNKSIVKFRAQELPPDCKMKDPETNLWLINERGFSILQEIIERKSRPSTLKKREPEEKPEETTNGEDQTEEATTGEIAKPWYVESLERKDAQITELTKALQNEQELNRIASQQILALQAPPETPESPQRDGKTLAIIGLSIALIIALGAIVWIIYLFA